MKSLISRQRKLLGPATLLAALAAGICLGRSPALGDDDDKKGGGKDRRVHQLMERVHEGRRSPLRQLDTLAGQDKPSWDDVNKLLPRFDEMSKALADTTQKAVHDAADGYIAAVKDIDAAAKKQDGATLKAAVKSLKSSCSDCHYQGGPGGKLGRD